MSESPFKACGRDVSLVDELSEKLSENPFERVE